MPFDLLAATADDFPAFVSIFEEAFKDDPNFKLMNPGCDPAVVFSRSLKRFRKDGGRPGRRHFKVIDRESGEIAGFSKWWYPHTPTPEQQAEEEEDERNPEPPLPGSNVALCESFERQLVAGRKKWINKTDMYFMNVLAVLPKYQRQGLGGLMLEPVLALANREGRKVYIEASKKGVGLYRRYGWIKIDSMLVDIRPYGGEMIEETEFMMRDPGTGKEIAAPGEEILSVIQQV